MTSSEHKTRRRLVSVLKFAVALGLLAFVFANVPWRDQALFESPEGTVSVTGEIDGSWEAERVRFHITPDEVASTAWPAEWRPALEGDQGFVLERTETTDWRPGLLTIFRGLEISGLLIAILLLLVGISCSVVRWWRLLRIAGCATTFGSAVRLTFLGLFFKLVVPGLAGGDVVKTVLVVREEEKKAAAFASVLLDRLLGLNGLLILTAVVVAVSGTRLAEWKLPIFSVLAVAVLILFTILHPAPRRLLRVDWILSKLPFGERIGRIDEALRLYGRHPFELTIALGLSTLSHLFHSLAILSLARAFGEMIGFGDTLCATSISAVIAAVPITPGGLGVEEAAYGYLFDLFGSSLAIGVAVGLTKRAIFTTFGLLGGGFLFVPGARARLRAAREGAAA